MEIVRLTAELATLGERASIALEPIWAGGIATNWSWLEFFDVSGAVLFISWLASHKLVSSYSQPPRCHFISKLRLSASVFERIRFFNTSFCTGWRASTLSTPPSPPLVASLAAATTSSSPRSPHLPISQNPRRPLYPILLPMAPPSPISTPHHLTLSYLHLHHLPTPLLLINPHIISSPPLNLSLNLPSSPPPVPAPLLLSLPNQCTPHTLKGNLQRDQARI